MVKDGAFYATEKENSRNCLAGFVAAETDAKDPKKTFYIFSICGHYFIRQLYKEESCYGKVAVS